MGNAIEGILNAGRERGLDRLAAGYAVGGWLLVQGASIALPAFDAPPWALRWLIVAIVVGFPLSLIGGWMLNRDRAATGGPVRLKGHEAVFLSLIVLIAVLSLGELAWHWSRGAAPAQISPSQASSAPANSIAVLPFANTSGDARQKYFSEGISEELIGRLARDPALRVAARTSSFFFEGKDEDVRTIAQKLNVRTVLEGSVRTDSNRVRIEADLIDAGSGYQLWSESYDRAQTDILLIQEDIARAIAQALVPTLTHSVRAAPKPTQIDPAVYRQYLQAQVYFDQRMSEIQTPESQQAIENSVALLRQVASAAPDFADGQAALAQALLVAEKGDEFDDQIKQAVSRALALDPENPQALVVSMTMALNNRDWDGAIDYAATLKRHSGHTAVGAEGLAQLYEGLYLNEQALAAYTEWAKLDPFSGDAWQGTARMNFALARYKDAIAANDRALALHPDDPITREYKCVSLASLNQIDAAKAVLSEISRPGVPTPTAFHCRFFITLHSQGAAAAVALLHNALVHDKEIARYTGDTGFMLSHAGADDEAMDWYQKSYDNGGFLFGFYPGESTPAAFFQNPRWIAFTKQPAYQKREAARVRALQVLGDNPS